MRTKLFAGWLAIFVLISGSLTAALAASTNTVEQRGIYEVQLNGPTNGNPFVDVRLSAVFDNGDKRVEVPGFYDGDGKYLIRFNSFELSFVCGIVRNRDGSTLEYRNYTPKSWEEL